MDSSPLLFDRHRRAGGGGVLVLGTGRDSTLLGWGSEIGNKRARSFFTSPEELLEEEYYYDEQTPEKKRRLTPEQVDLLEKSFEEENKLEPERKSELAKKLGVQPRQVAVWFQNRRARWKTKQLEHDFDRLKASYDALLADHHTVLKDNDHLRSQVMLLKDKLQAAESMVLNVENNASSSSEGLAIVHSDLKAEDSLSARGGGSPGLPECGTQQLIVSTGDSNFPDSYQELGCPVGYEEDDSCGYLPEVLEQQQADAVALFGTGWWVWS